MNVWLGCLWRKLFCDFSVIVAAGVLVDLLISFFCLCVSFRDMLLQILVVLVRLSVWSLSILNFLCRVVVFFSVGVLVCLIRVVVSAAAAVVVVVLMLLVVRILLILSSVMKLSVVLVDVLRVLDHVHVLVRVVVVSLLLEHVASILSVRSWRPLL